MKRTRKQNRPAPVRRSQRKALRGHYGIAVKAVRRILKQRIEEAVDRAGDEVRAMLSGSMTIDDNDENFADALQSTVTEAHEEIVEWNHLLRSMTDPHRELRSLTLETLRQSSPDLVDELRLVGAFWRWLDVTPQELD